MLINNQSLPRAYLLTRAISRRQLTSIFFKIWPFILLSNWANSSLNFPWVTTIAKGQPRTHLKGLIFRQEVLNSSGKFGSLKKYFRLHLSNLIQFTWPLEKIQPLPYHTHMCVRIYVCERNEIHTRRPQNHVYGNFLRKWNRNVCPSPGEIHLAPNWTGSWLCLIFLRRISSMNKTSRITWQC